MAHGTCSLPGCDKVGRLLRGWCEMHYQRWTNTGRFDLITTEERFWAKVRPTGFCWEWTASIKPNGYGQFGTPGNRTVYSHRFAYELLVGPIPDGNDLDHLCRNRACCNPDHLEPVSRPVNIRRSPVVTLGIAARMREAAKAA